MDGPWFAASVLPLSLRHLWSLRLWRKGKAPRRAPPFRLWRKTKEGATRGRDGLRRRFSLHSGRSADASVATLRVTLSGRFSTPSLPTIFAFYQYRLAGMAFPWDPLSRR